MKLKTTLFIFVLLSASFLNGQILFPFRKADKWGFCDSSKKIIIAPKYELADVFYKDNIAAIKFNKRFGFINKKGEEITEIKFHQWGLIYQGYRQVWVGHKVGIIDSTGQELIPIMYNNILFSEKVICLQKDTQWLIFNYKGKKISSQTFTEVKPNLFNLIAVKINEKWGFIDSFGKLLVKPKFEEIKDYSNQNYCGVKQNGLWGYINDRGKVVIKPIYKEAIFFQNEGAWVKKNEKWGLIDKKGEIIIPNIYEDVSEFYEGLALVKFLDKYGYINQIGNVVVPFNYDWGARFSEGLAEVCYSDDSCGYIDKNGKTIIPFLYSKNHFAEFNEGIVEVRIDTSFGFINKKGEIIIPIQYDSPYINNSFYNRSGMLFIKPKNYLNFYNQQFYFDKYGTLFYED